jgi:ribulose-phosphate 3-epimerase
MEKNNIIELIPAVMPATYGDLKDLVRKAAQVSEWVQLDVMDGKYTTSKSWPYYNKGNHFMKIMSGEEGLPFWQEVNYSLDLMTLSPHEEALRWAEAGVARIILHYNSFKDEEALRTTIEALKERMVEVVVAILPGSNITLIEPFQNIIDGVQCMGIENVGFQGEPFVESAVTTVSELAKTYPHLTISVDGSVNEETVSSLHDAGATRFAIGSYFVESGADIKERQATLLSLLDVK